MSKYNLIILYGSFLLIIGSFSSLLAQTKEKDDTLLPKHFIQLRAAVATASNTVASQDRPFLGFGNDMFIAGGSDTYPQFGIEYAYWLRPNLYIGTGLNFLAYKPDFSTWIARSFFEEIEFNAQVPAEYQDIFDGDGYFKYHDENDLGFEVPIFLSYYPKIWSGLHWQFTAAFTLRGLWKKPGRVEDFLSDENGTLLKILEINYTTQVRAGWRFELGPGWQFKNGHIIGINAVWGNNSDNLMLGNHRLLPNQSNEKNGVYEFKGSYIGLELKCALALPYK